MLMSKQPYPRESPVAVAITKVIAEHVVVDLKPISTVEEPGFKNMLKMIDSRYVPVSRNHLLDKYIWPMYYETVDKVKEERSIAHRHAFTTDGWQSMATDSYNTTTARYIEPETFKLKSNVLDTKMWLEKHIGENLANVMKSSVQKWGLKDPVAVSDNASNITLGVKLADYPYLGCFAHILNLAVGKALDITEVNSLGGRCRSLVTQFKTVWAKKDKTNTD